MNKYEISLWEDFPDISSNNTPFLNERKLCVIGSDTMQTRARAVEPKMVSNNNGTNTFTFKMYQNYIDNLTGENYKNPFLHLLVNERKVKVYWEDKWYDLIIKNIDEDSSGKGITYTCTDQFINELSKNGYNLEFTQELQNNIGTAAELTKKVLKNSGWQFDEINSTPIIQKTEEPVYEVITNDVINATKQSPNGDEQQIIPTNKKILVFYSCAVDIVNTDFINKDIQFLYSDSGYQTDDNEMLVINGDCYSSTFQVRRNNQYIEFYQGNIQKFQINTDAGVSIRYRAERLVKTQITAYDDLLERYVYVYNDTELSKLVYGYQTSEFSDPLSVVNLIVNSSNFKNLDGWIGNDLVWGAFPKLTSTVNISNYKTTSYLKVTSGNIYNKAFSSNKQYLMPSQGDIKKGELGGLHVGDKYIFRLKFKNNCEDPSSVSYSFTDNITPIVSTFNSNYQIMGQNYFTINNNQRNGDWYEYNLICNTACAADDIEKLGFFLQVNSPCWIQEVQFFKYETGITSYDSTIEQRLNPGEVSLQGIEKISYKYYNINHDGAEKPEQLVFLYESDTPSSRFVPVYNNYEKMTSIEASESNRFNILQSIAETFKCWIRFTINHNSSGKTLFDENGVAQKYVAIVENIGEDLGWSFEYGIDLKSIRRKVVSNELATKIIVLPNNNEFGKQGFCSISRSNLNYAKENFILNLDYYTNQGLLDKNILELDLYSTSSNYIGYYYFLHQYNKEYDEITNILIEKQLELIKQQAQLKVFEEKNRAANEQLTNSKSDIMMLAGVTTWEEAQGYVQLHTDNVKVQSLMNSISQLQQAIEENINQIENLANSIYILSTFIDEKIERQQELSNLTNDLHERFFNKYARFIQEGTWQDENYMDDDKYYLDALEVAYTSSRPQIEYQIDIMRLNSLEDFSSKKFNIGDICYIQDREFFGYCTDNITPYKLKITINEITSFFDQPEKDTIKVQNYKTQFDDLFQRITATTQSLQYAQGTYNKTASVINSDKTFNFDLLQETFDNNQDLILNSSNQQVTWDSTGITVVDNNNTGSKVKLMAGGLFVTNDGGITWKNAVRGDGISTEILTAGKINTSEIYIYDGNAPSFRWDSNGLTAYSHSNNEINFNRFIRYDQYGIYGYDGNRDFVPGSEEDVWNNSNFGLTWKGFFLRNRNANTSFEISTDNDLIIKNGNINRVQIGRLNNSLTNYGLQLCDNNGNIIFVVDNNGAKIGGWTISSTGLVDPNSDATLSMDQIKFGDVTINNNGINFPAASYLKLNEVSCETKTLVAPTSITVELQQDGTQQVTSQMSWTENGTTHNVQATFYIPKYVINNSWVGESCNVICTTNN